METNKECPLCEGSGINPAGSEYGVCPACKGSKEHIPVTEFPEIDPDVFDKYELENGLNVYVQKFTKFNG